MALGDTVLDLLFPPKCVFCRRVQRSGPVCGSCRQTLTHLDAMRAGRSFRCCWTPMSYEGAVRDAILRFKFEDRPAYARPLGGILARCVQDHLAEEFDRITWTPVSARRLRTRGYDQARLLAESAAEALGGQSALPLLEKHTHTAAQSSLDDAAQRRENVKNVYRVPDPALVKGQRILLIDDIVTTGATLEEASRTLLEAGARSVVAAALAQP